MDLPPERRNRDVRSGASDESTGTRCSARIRKLDPDFDCNALSSAGSRKRGKRVPVENVDRKVENATSDGVSVVPQSAVNSGYGQSTQNSVENLENRERNEKGQGVKSPLEASTARMETRVAGNLVYPPVTFETTADQWNAVDVDETDTVKRGLIVDLRKSGWLVDFGIPGKSPELVLYEKIPVIRKKKNANRLPQVPYDHPRVLLRLAHDQPWTWHDCIVRKISRKCFIVQVIGNESIVEAVGRDRVRFLPGEPNPRRNDIVEARLPVPQDSVLDAKFMDIWKENFSCTHLIGINEGILRLLQRRRDRAITERELLLVLENVADQRYSLLTLPLHVIVTVFSFLEVAQQQAVRPVCAAWNHAVLCYASAESALLSHDSSYLFSKSLLISVKNSAKSLIVKGGRRSISVLAILQKTWMLKPFKLSILVLANVTIEAKELLTEANTVADSVRSVCSRMILRQVMIRHLYGYSCLNTYSTFSYGSIRSAVLDTDNNPELLLKFFEKAARRISLHSSTYKGEMKRLKRWIHSATKDVGAAKIIQVLQKWQPNDARFRPHILWDTIQAALEVALANHKSLRRSTIQALMCAMDSYEQENDSSSESSDDDSTDAE